MLAPEGRDRGLAAAQGYRLAGIQAQALQLAPPQAAGELQQPIEICRAAAPLQLAPAPGKQRVSSQQSGPRRSFPIPCQHVRDLPANRLANSVAQSAAPRKPSLASPARNHSGAPSTSKVATKTPPTSPCTAIPAAQSAGPWEASSLSQSPAIPGRTSQSQQTHAARPNPSRPADRAWAAMAQALTPRPPQSRFGPQLPQKFQLQQGPGGGGGAQVKPLANLLQRGPGAHRRQ